MENLDILYFIKAVTQNSALFEFLSKEGQEDVLEYLDTQINIEKFKQFYN